MNIIIPGRICGTEKARIKRGWGYAVIRAKSPIGNVLLDFGSIK